MKTNLVLALGLLVSLSASAQATPASYVGTNARRQACKAVFDVLGSQANVAIDSVEAQIDLTGYQTEGQTNIFAGQGAQGVVQVRVTDDSNGDLSSLEIQEADSSKVLAECSNLKPAK